MNSYGIKISKPGFDVKDPALAPKDMIWASHLDTFKAKTFGQFSGTFLGANASQTFTIAAHGLGYAPAFFGLVKLASGVYAALPFANTFTDLSARVATTRMFADATNIYARVTGFVGVDLVLEYKYYIFYNQLD